MPLSAARIGWDVFPLFYTVRIELMYKHLQLGINVYLTLHVFANRWPVGRYSELQSVLYRSREVREIRMYGR